MRTPLGAARRGGAGWRASRRLLREPVRGAPAAGPSVRCSQPEGGAPAPGAAEEQGEWEGEELEGEEEGEEEGRGEEQARRARCMCACRRGARVSPFFPFIFFSILSLIDMTGPRQIF